MIVARTASTYRRGYHRSSTRGLSRIESSARNDYLAENASSMRLNRTRRHAHTARSAAKRRTIVPYNRHISARLRIALQIASDIRVWNSTTDAAPPAPARSRYRSAIDDYITAVARSGHIRCSSADTCRLFSAYGHNSSGIDRYSSTVVPGT